SRPRRASTSRSYPLVTSSGATTSSAPSACLHTSSARRSTLAESSPVWAAICSTTTSLALPLRRAREQPTDIEPVQRGEQQQRRQDGHDRAGRDQVLLGQVRGLEVGQPDRQRLGGPVAQGQGGERGGRENVDPPGAVDPRRLQQVLGDLGEERPQHEDGPAGAEGGVDQGDAE